MPSLPTLDESGLRGYDYSNWNGVTGPAGLPIDAQLIGPYGMDQKTLVHAEWVRRALTVFRLLSQTKKGGNRFLLKPHFLL